MGVPSSMQGGQHPLQPPLCPPKLIKDLWGKNRGSQRESQFSLGTLQVSLQAEQPQLPQRRENKR